MKKNLEQTGFIKEGGLIEEGVEGRQRLISRGSFGDIELVRMGDGEMVRKDFRGDVEMAQFSKAVHKALLESGVPTFDSYQLVDDDKVLLPYIGLENIVDGPQDGEKMLVNPLQGSEATKYLEEMEGGVSDPEKIADQVLLIVEKASEAGVVLTHDSPFFVLQKTQEGFDLTDVFIGDFDQVRFAEGGARKSEVKEKNLAIVGILNHLLEEYSFSEVSKESLHKEIDKRFPLDYVVKSWEEL